MSHVFLFSPLSLSLATHPLTCHSSPCNCHPSPCLSHRSPYLATHLPNLATISSISHPSLYLVPHLPTLPSTSLLSYTCLRNSHTSPCLACCGSVHTVFLSEMDPWIRNLDIRIPILKAKGLKIRILARHFCGPLKYYTVRYRIYYITKYRKHLELFF
jgi:hypothetical protein